MNTAVGTRYNIQLMQKAYPTIGQVSFTLVPSNMQIYLHSFSAFNASNAACDIGLGVVQNNTTWKLYTVAVNTGAAATDSTAAIQAGTATNIFTTTANQGFLVESSKQFGYVMIHLTQAETGSPVYSYQYWNGSAWTTLNMSQTPVYTSTGYIYLAFNPPTDWATGDNGLGANTGYSIRVRSTTAGGQAVKADSVRVARWFCYRQSVPSVSQLQVIFDNHPDLLEAGEAIVPYFQTANNSNSVEAAFQQMS